MPTSQRPRNSLPRIQPSLEEAYATLPATRQQKRTILENQLPRVGAGIGSPTRGWRAIAPQKGMERDELLQRCGNACFLNPANKGFPICPALRTTRGQCGVDCRGLEAAKVRARQYRHFDIADQAQALQYQYGCEVRAGSRNRITYAHDDNDDDYADYDDDGDDDYDDDY
jgi:hypothetical protein